MEGIRSFIAIEVPRALQIKIADLQSELKEAEADVRWVDPEKIHLTLQFLGSVSQENITKIIQELPPVISGYAPFALRLGGLGSFPGSRNPRVLWVGIQGGIEDVSRLQKAVERRVCDILFSSPERPFKPHLTIGRVRSAKKIKALSRVIELQQAVEIGTFTALEVHLFKSDLQSSGAIHTKLQSFDLEKS